MDSTENRESIRLTDALAMAIRVLGKFVIFSASMALIFSLPQYYTLLSEQSPSGPEVTNELIQHRQWLCGRLAANIVILIGGLEAYCGRPIIALVLWAVIFFIVAASLPVR